MQNNERVRSEGFNTARFFVQNTHVAWVLLVVVLVWGFLGYRSMPKRKDPEIPVRVAAALCPWPGVRAEKVEELVTRRMEERISENDKVDRVDSTTRTGLAVVIVKLVDQVSDTGPVLDDINLKLASIPDLPEGAGPIKFIKDFGDTATLMLTVASPPVSGVEVELRAKALRALLDDLRAGTGPEPRAALCVVAPEAMSPAQIRRKLDLLASHMARQPGVADVRARVEPGLAVLDMVTTRPDQELADLARGFADARLRSEEVHPDLWDPVVVRDPAGAEAALASAGGSRFTHRELEAATDEISRTLKTLPTVSKVSRWGVQPERIHLEYSQERLAAYGLGPADIRQALSARNILRAGGRIEFQGKTLLIEPGGEFRSVEEIGATQVGRTRDGAPLYLRDLVETERAYETPAQNLNFHLAPDKDGNWRRMRAVTMGVTMRSGEQIGAFSRQVDAALAELSARLPEGLVLARTSDQPRQVEEKVDLFMVSLYEAVALVVLVAFIGFFEWRSAVLMALSIPVTLAMTFGMMRLLGIDLQQISIASLVIALGLIVDDPVVAGDAIRHDLDSGLPPEEAAWVGPTRLAKAILYATLTNIVAYLPYLLLTGDKGRFLFSLPIVVSASLVASRLVSMTFLPLLARYLLRPGSKPAPTLEERRTRGFTGRYYRLCAWLVDNRRKALAASLVVLAAGFGLKAFIPPQFFPHDLSYLSYLNVWLPEDAAISASDRTAQEVERVVLDAVADYSRTAPEAEKGVLRRMTTFVGGGGPRFWFSITPELNQANYAQILLETTDNRASERILPHIQRAVDAAVPGARVDVRRLESGPPIGVPVQVRISGEDIPTLRGLAERLKVLFRGLPHTERVFDNWGAEIFTARIDVDQDRAAAAGLTNQDVAASSAAAMSGFPATTLREGRLTIPAVLRLRAEERAAAGDVENLYVFSADGARKVPLRQAATVSYDLETEKIVRRSHFRTITVGCFPAPGVLPSEVVAQAMPELKAMERELPPGYRMEIGGEHEEQVKGFDEMAVVMGVSVLSIYLALLFQFRNAVKPLIVFAAVPYGMAGAFAALFLTGQAFGFMAYLGIVSLMGVIVSHIIVLFDFIEERKAEGGDLRQALLDAGIMRLRPVLITVAATVFALIPLALHGGPLWEPLCYAQIGGLTIATCITLLLAPVLYAVAAFDLKLVK